MTYAGQRALGFTLSGFVFIAALSGCTNGNMQWSEATKRADGASGEKRLVFSSTPAKIARFQDYDLSVSGGSGEYTFSIVSGPSGANISQNRFTSSKAGVFKIKVIDNKNPGLYGEVEFEVPRGGTLDESFNGTGYVITRLGSYVVQEANTVTLRTDSSGNTKILVAGHVDTGSTLDAAILQYNSTGELDTGFGESTGYTIPGRTGNEVINSIAVYNNKIFLAGWSASCDSVNPDLDPACEGNTLLYRMSNQGAYEKVDERTVEAGVPNIAHDIVVGDNSVFLIGDITPSAIPQKYLVLKYSNGITTSDDLGLDTGYQNGGIKSGTICWAGNFRSAVHLGGNELVVVGDGRDGGNTMGLIARITSSGALLPSTTFGNIPACPVPVNDSTQWLAVKPSMNGFVAAGYQTISTVDTGRMCRYNASGWSPTCYSASLSPTAGAKNRVTALASWGQKLLAAGWYDSAGTPMGSLKLFDATSTSPDQDFGDTANPGLKTGLFAVQHQIRGVAVQSDGRIVIVGYVTTTDGKDIFVARLYP